MPNEAAECNDEPIESNEMNEETNESDECNVEPNDDMIRSADIRKHK